ncbi:HAD family hydrolase [Flagellimonas allohymeniacidonis]|uniref:HAD family phosphatase n=1 Tax=Flagellimonas allohymeniacidonis TaxID=2517819 RepID=A0A4V2HSN2_9FLAO|nr:HAD family phosphatase [Allomuricauda hymeniacidonis]TAI48410.1 HAD family phosphatase [Allomuricauda hymeniacidonis]
MIKAVIFDLDGTLIQTEVLKATSYAKAIHYLTKGQISESNVLDIFGQFVGLSRSEVVRGLANHFSEELGSHLKTNDLELIGEQLIEKRLEEYRSILEDTDLLSQHFCTFTLGLFHKVYSDELSVVLATMSHLPEAKRITSIMGIHEKFNLVLTRDDVKNGKPDPEIYDLAKKRLGLQSDECLVIEDSVNGIKAAQNANMTVFAVTNKVTRKSVHECQLLEPAYIVDQLEGLSARIYSFIESKKKESQKSQ